MDNSDFHHISLFGEMILTNILSDGLPVSQEKKDELIKIVETSLQQVVFKYTGGYDRVESESLVRIASDMYLNLLDGSEFLVFAIIPPKRYLEFSLSPYAFVGLHKEDLRELAQTRFLQMSSNHANVSGIAKVFVNLLVKSLKIAKHENFLLEND